MSDEGNIIDNIDFGQSVDVLNNKPNSPLAELLQQLTNDVIGELQESAFNRKLDASANLIQSILITKPEYKGNEVTIGITMPFYWEYVNYGVNGTERNNGAPSWGKAPAQSTSFFSSISSWVRNKGIIAPPQFNSYESFSWAIIANKKKFGQVAKPFFEDVVNPSLVKKLQEPIEKLLGKSIIVNIITQWQ